jgi:hypothetical protein
MLRDVSNQIRRDVSPSVAVLPAHRPLQPGSRPRPNSLRGKRRRAGGWSPYDCARVTMGESDLINVSDAGLVVERLDLEPAFGCHDVRTTASMVKLGCSILGSGV